MVHCQNFINPMGGKSEFQKKRMFGWEAHIMQYTYIPADQLPRLHTFNPNKSWESNVFLQTNLSNQNDFLLQKKKQQQKTTDILLVSCDQPLQVETKWSWISFN